MSQPHRAPEIWEAAKKGYSGPGASRGQAGSEFMVGDSMLDSMAKLTVADVLLDKDFVKLKRL